MSELLFSPNGRISRNRFWQGMVVLTVATILVSAGSRLIALPFVFLHIALAYPYACVVGKRLHDAGFTAWLSIIVWIAYLFINQVVSRISGAFLISPETMQIYETMLAHLERNEAEPAMEGLIILLRETVSVAVVSAIASGAAIAFAIGYLPGQPQENKHGPVPV